MKQSKYSLSDVSFSFHNQICLITGASRGIGAALAKSFANAGAKVAINYHTSAEEAEAVNNQIVKQGGTALLTQGDVGNEDDIYRILNEIEKVWNNIPSILIQNCAAFDRSSIQTLTLGSVDRLWNVNVRGPLLLSHIISKRLIEQNQEGNIVFMSSILARKVIPYRIAYAATKGAVESITKAMALDLAPYNIRVNAIAPGLIDTEALRAGIEENVRKSFNDYLPLRRFGTPEEIASVALFLCSDAARYVTGTIIEVDGGLGALEAGPPCFL